MALDRLLDSWHARVTARYDRIVVLALAVAIMVWYGLKHGQDLNWDSRNYHFASAYLFLNGLLPQQVAPSQLQTWFNPLVYVPSYWMIRYWSPVAVSVALAVVPAFNAPLLYAICKRCLAGIAPARARLDALVSVAVGLTGALFLSEVGTTFVDDTLSILMLGSALAVVRAMDEPDGRASLWLLAGALLGISVGLKLTNAVFGVAFCAACLPMLASRAMSMRGLVLIVVGAGAGFLVSGGWWAAYVWIEYGNPVFPLLNNVFRSPLADAVSTTDPRFVPENLFEMFYYPVRMALGEHSTPSGHIIGAEVWFREPRYLLGALVSVAFIALSFMPRARVRVGGPLAFLSWFFVISLALWLAAFGIARYVVVLELLAGVLIVSFVRKMLPLRGILSLVAPGIVGLLVIIGTMPGRWDRYPFGGEWFGVENTAAIHRPGTVYVFTDTEPLAYLIPFFPADARFVRAAGNIPFQPDRGLGAQSAAIMSAARGPVRSLALVGHDAQSQEALRSFGLRIAAGSCRIIHARAENIQSCAVVKG